MKNTRIQPCLCFGMVADRFGVAWMVTVAV